MPKIWCGAKRVLPKLDTQVREQLKCICSDHATGPMYPARLEQRNRYCMCLSCTAERLERLGLELVKVAETKIELLPRATLVKLARFGLLARAKRTYREWRRKQQELSEAKRARELQMLKELEHSTESVLRLFRRGSSHHTRDWPGPGG